MSHILECCYNFRRQPVILTDEEKEKIDKEHPDSYEHAINYGSDPKINIGIYVQDIGALKPIQALVKEVEEGVCGGKDAIIPFHASKVPKGKYIFEFNASAQHTASDGSYISTTWFS